MFDTADVQLNSLLLQNSFEWFVKMLTELEMEQAETGGEIGR